MTPPRMCPDTPRMCPTPPDLPPEQPANPSADDSPAGGSRLPVSAAELAARSFTSLGRRCVFLTGPTASGKSQLALELAEKLGGEILSLDSIALYRRMDIGTAKPTPADRRRVPHHLLDLVEPWESFSISQYLSAAHECVRGVEQSGKLPIFVGGTPLYMKALLRGFFSGPAPDWDFRNAVQSDVAAHGNEALHRRLQQVDPLLAHQLPPGDVRRITRALEVAYLTGKPLSHWQNQFESHYTAAECRVYALRMPREQLHRRIAARVSRMFDEGLVDEVREIQAAASAAGQPGFSRSAGQAVGYREVLAHLAGQTTLEETREAVTTHTRQLAKRQETWLRSLDEVRHMDLEPGTTAETYRLDELVSRIAEACQNFPDG